MKDKVYVLQDGEEACKEIRKAFENDETFEVAKLFTDGITAISSVIEEKPEFLITGLVLSGNDGLSVIEKIKGAGAKTKIIVVSAISGEETVSKAIKAGAEYYMAKPLNGEILKERMREIKKGEEKGGRYVRGTSLEEKISRIFINVGIPAHIKGYAFLREGVKMAVEEPEIINSITKELYPRIGEAYKTTASKVERAIRHAIEVAWNKGRVESINAILGVRAYVGNERPTNGEFIALIADKMLLERSS